MKKLISNIIFIIYLIIAIFVTVCLLSYNDYKVTVFGDTSLVIVSDNKMEPNYKKGDLVFVENSDKYEVGDQVFYYNTYNEQIKIRIGTISAVEKGDNSEIVYTLDNEEEQMISNKFVVGTTSTAKSIQNVGLVLGILESKWGFLFLIVLPALLAFVNQIMVVVAGIKETKEKSKDE